MTDIKLTIEEQELRTILENLSGLEDFDLVIKKEYNEKDYGYYYYNRKLIELYVVDEHGDSMDRDTIIKAGIHEITHHVIINHSDNEEEDLHGEAFKELFAKYMRMYYNGRVPKRLLNEIRREGLNVSKKKG